MAEFETILFEVRERVARISLNRREQLNALSFKMREELSAAFDRCAADREVRAVVLAAAGRAFCAGVDLADGRGERLPDNPPGTPASWPQLGVAEASVISLC